MESLMAILAFSVAVSGDGDMLSPFVARLQLQYPQVVLYDRNEEAQRDDPEAGMPAIPSPADIDVIFKKTGAKEMATIRSFHRHRFFNYDLDDLQQNPAQRNLLLNSMIQAIDSMLEPPEPKPDPAPGAEPEPEQEVNPVDTEAS
jgi:hypothetical protein